MSTDVGLLFQIFCEPGKINTQIGNADQRSIYVKSATCNKCKLQMFDLILIRYTYSATANTFLLLKQWHHKRLFCLAMLCFECVDVRKDNCHTFSFFICLLCIIFAIDFFLQVVASFTSNDHLSMHISEQFPGETKPPVFFLTNLPYNSFEERK